jgi:hypothetical protein
MCLLDECFRVLVLGYGGWEFGLYYASCLRDRIGTNVVADFRFPVDTDGNSFIVQHRRLRPILQSSYRRCQTKLHIRNDHALIIQQP